MARLSKNETSANTAAGAAAAPARRRPVAAPRNRAVAPVPEAAVVSEQPAPSAPAHEDIAALAYSYWVERGFAEGSPEHDWLRAEAELRARVPATA